MRRRDFIALLSWVVAEWPLAVRAQQSNLPVIGYLSGGEANERVPLTLAFKEGLGELGLVEGRNVAIEYRWAEGNYDRLPALAADLVNRHVTVLPPLMPQPLKLRKRPREQFRSHSKQEPMLYKADW